MTETTPQKKSFGVLWTALIILFAVSLVLVSQFRLWRNSKFQNQTVSITAGSRSGLRHQIAETLSNIAATDGLKVQVVATDGSLDAMSKVDSGELQFALIQGGLSNQVFSNVRQAAVLHIEPLHLLVRFPNTESPPDHWTIEKVAGQLNRKEPISINLSRPNSGTHAIASDLLQFFDLESGKDFLASEFSYRQLLDPEFPPEKLPDMVFTVSSLPSPVAKHLIHNHGYRPLELNVSNAYRLDWTAQNWDENRQVIRRKVVAANIPAFSYQINPPVPKDDVKTIGTRLQLVANKDVSTFSVEKMIEVVYTSSFATTSEPPLAIDLLRTSAEFDLHTGAAEYLEKKTPVITEKLVEVTEQVLAILGTIFGGVLFAWQAMSFVRRRRRDRQFLQCVSRVGEIEHRAMEFETNDDMSIDDLVQLQQELNDIKSEMIQQFQKGDIDGADTLSGFLMHVNDANENLTRMILHERQPRPAQN